MEYASNGKGNLGVTLGAIGTGLGVLGGGNFLNGLGMSRPNGDYISKDEATLYQTIAAKDSEIALLKSESNLEKKMLEVYNSTENDISALRDSTMSAIKELQREVNLNRREQDAWNANQSVANAQISSAIATNTTSISAIQGLIGQITMTKVPNSAVCPGWGNVSVTTSTATTNA